MSIPVIGTAVVSDTYWISRLIASVDYPVDNFVVINNNGRGQINEALDNLAKIPHRYIRKITICHMPANIGCSGAWNLIIKCYMMSSYWIIVNDDVAFGPGLLEELKTKADADPDVGMIHGYEGDFGVGSWDLFMIRDHIVQNYGLFDENLYPAYCEDADYHMKFVHRPIKKIMKLDSNYLHGFGDKTQYHTHGKQTKKSNPQLEMKLNIINDMNINYLTDKWGKDWRTCWPSTEPWPGRLKSIKINDFDLDFVRKKNLGF
jgi:hypothetical protein